MNATEREVIEIVRGGLDGKTITGFIRRAFNDSPEDIAILVNKIFKLPTFDNNQIAKIRVILARVSKENGVPRMSVRLVQGKYELVYADRRSSDMDVVFTNALNACGKASDFDIETKNELLGQIKKVMGI